VRDGRLTATPLNGRQGRNLLLMLATRQLVQAVVVGLALFAFFIALGLIVVTPETAEQWIGGPPVPSVVLPMVPVALLRNATLFAAFAACTSRSPR
jgi:DNA segregation ATPase FtsK/SpoIIIE-like protein